MQSLLGLAVAVAMAAMAFVVSPADSAVIFEDNFNGHAADTLLSSYTPPVGVAYTGPWKIITDGGVGGTDYTGQTTPLDNEQAFISAANTLAVTGQKVQFDYDYYGNYYLSTGSDFVTFDAGAGGYTGRGWDLMLNGNGSIQYYNKDVGGTGVVTVAPAGTFAYNAWTHVTVTADYGTHTFDATVGTYGFSGAWEASGGSTFQQLYMAANGTNLFYIDNLSIIQVVPEPATLMHLGVAALAGMPRRRRPAR